MHTKTPIYTALKEYAQQGVLRLHMPGHAGGCGFIDHGLKQIAEIDVTEVPGTGNLHVPEGVIEQSRILLAKAFGARESLFLVNGASSGIHTLLMSLNRKQKKVIVPRNAHRSFYAGMVLSGIEPVYVPCQISSKFGLAMSVRSSDIVDLLDANQDIETVFITSPNYYGITCDVTAICKEVKKRPTSVSVLVDEAHGGHFPFHDSYPRPALKSGADAVVNGLHKTLPILNQGACLHVQDEQYFWNQIFPAWSMLTTSSPSYPILASIDLARSFMMIKGQAVLEKSLELSNKYKHKIGEIRGLSVCTEEELINIPGTAEMDPLKLLINVRDIGITGDQLAQMLRQEYSIQVEMAAPNYILAMMSMFHRTQDWELLYEALKEIVGKYPGNKEKKEDVPLQPEPQVRLTPREAFFSKAIEVDFSYCRGKISAEVIAPYPPGIPCLLPGELINENVYEYLEFLKKGRISLYGPGDSSLTRVRIIDY